MGRTQLSRSPRHASPRHGSPRHGSPRHGSPRRTCQEVISVAGHLEVHEGNSVVEETFRAFCGANRSLDGRSFAKLCRDCHLIDKRFTATDADIVFAKVVPNGLRRADLPQFEMALCLVAEKKGVELNVVYQAVALVKGPTLLATKADPVRFHDDKSTYTGTHFYGGPDPAL